MANTKPINILVYTGEGTTPTSVRHAFYTLRKILSPYYVVLPISSSALLNEPWIASCAALVIPGGADTPYCRLLNGDGNRRIQQYVQNGGKYIGLCAGAYYATSRCEFMEGHRFMEVMGGRELKFYPGICRGLAFKGFKYQSEAGARAAKLDVKLSAFKDIESFKEKITPSILSYYNGGGVFVDANRYESEGKIEVLANYVEDLNCDSGEGKAAIVYCKVGQGAVLLTGPHPEFAAVNLEKDKHGDDYKATVEELEKGEEARQVFFKACLVKLGLQVNLSAQPVPSLSPLHLSCLNPSETSSLLSSWKDIISESPSKQLYIVGENDTFHIRNPPESLVQFAKPNTPDDLNLSSLTISDSENEAENFSGNDRIVDYDKMLKHLIIHMTEIPPYKETPQFNHAIYYASLSKFTGPRRTKSSFGEYLLYGEVVTSTSTILDKNNVLLRTLPTGFTATASTQLSGRGRGSNVWASPAGSLMFSTVIWHPSALGFSAPVVFVQYLAAMAVVQAATQYARGYDRLRGRLRLKWPNDIYADSSNVTASESSSSSSASGGGGKNQKGVDSYVKIGGVLVNSSYSGDSYGLVVGVGMNVANAAPTTGLDALAAQCGLPAFQRETLLAKILAAFEDLYNIFCVEGWGRKLEDIYYGMWLHDNQIVTVESEGGLRARIKGVTRDWGLLLAEELSLEDRATGHTIALQTDSNSFDFFRGLIKRKV